MFFVSVKNKIFRKRIKDEDHDSKKKGRLIILSVAGFVVLSSVLWVVWASVRMPSASFCEGVGEYSLKASTQGKREEFFAQFGYEASSIASYEITVPSQGENLKAYNEIQKKQGMNIMPYGDKQAQMYVLSLTDDKGETLYGFLMVYKNRVIGAHISDCSYPARVMSLRE